jgi:mannosyltransferase
MFRDDLALADPPQVAGRDNGPGPGIVARLFWLWPALVTLVYGVWGIRTPSLWADELATWGAVRLSWRSMYQLLGSVDAVVGPYFTLVKAWTTVAGTSTLALRLPSVGAMVLSAALVALLGARLGGGRWAGLLAGLAFAVVPTTSRYAQEARPYAFVILFAILATLLLVRLADHPSPANAVWYALAVAGLGAFHLVALLLLLAHAPLVWHRALRLPASTAGAGFWRRRARPTLPWAVAAAAGVLPTLPLAWLGYRQSAQISWIKAAHWRDLLAAPDTLFVSGVIGGFLIALALLAVSRRWEALLLLSWALVPVGALYVIGKVTPLFWPRYLLYTMPAWVLLGTLTLTRLSRTRAVALLVALVLLAHPEQFQLRAADGHSHGDRQAAGIIAANMRPGDGIAYKLDEQPEPWEARDLVARYVPADRQPRDVFAVTPQRTDGHLLATECPDLVVCLDRAEPQRMWIIRFAAATDPLKNLGQPKEDLLRGRYRLDRIWLVKGLTVALLVRG